MDSQTHEASLDWAAGKESEITAKLKKARRKEKKRHKLAESQLIPTTATETVIAKLTLKGKAVAPVTKKPEKFPADASAQKATTGDKKRKMSVVGDKGLKKQVASKNVPPVKKTCHRSSEQL